MQFIFDWYNFIVTFFMSQLKTILTMGCFDAINAKAFCNVHNSRLVDLILTLSVQCMKSAFL